MDGSRSWKGRTIGIFLGVVLVVGFMPSWVFAQEAQNAQPSQEASAVAEQQTAVQGVQEQQEAALPEDAQLAEEDLLVPSQNRLHSKFPRLLRLPIPRRV